MSAAEAAKKLFSLQLFGIKLGLDNITGFLKKLGNPQQSFKSFHVAGSNGKGSTASFISSILMEASYKTGLYTSPHFVRFNERIRINGNEIPDDYIITFVESEWDYIEKNKLTFFEATTALAFKYFAEMKIDYGVIETGLGGRLDATNVLSPIASIITSISLEHTHILGDTVEKIASEKAGIIKEGGKVFTGLLDNSSLDVIKKTAELKKDSFFYLDDFISFDSDKLNFTYGAYSIKNLDVPLRGIYQKINAALAAAVCINTIENIRQDVIEKGISRVKENSQITGRYEVVYHNPSIILDSAHNPDGIKNFLSEFQQDAESFAVNDILFAAMKDKAINQMLEQLSFNFDNFYFTKLDFERSATAEELITIAESLNLKAKKVGNIEVFLKKYIKKNKNSSLVIIGSMYLVGKIKELIENKVLDIL